MKKKFNTNVFILKNTTIKIIIILTICSSIYANNSSPHYTILKKFPSPTSGPMGLAYDGQNFWTVDPIDRALISFSLNEGELIKYFPLPIGFWSGVTFDGEYLLVINVKNNKVLKINSLTGEIIETIIVKGKQTISIQYSKEYTWIADSKGKGHIAKVDSETLQEEINLFIAPRNNPFGLAIDHSSLWVSNATRGGIGTIHRINKLNGNEIKSFAFPEGKGALTGLEIVDGHLWILSNSTNMVYKLKI